MSAEVVGQVAEGGGAPPKDIEAQEMREEEDDLGVELRARAFSHSGPAVFLSFENLAFEVNERVGGRRKPCGNAPSEGVVSKKKKILQDVTGFTAPGELVALMGASGAGKTSLLNILAGRNPSFTGKVRINGKPMSRQMRRNVAFCQQEDIFIGTLTVEEHLFFQAKLRMPRGTTDEQARARVEELLSDLGLRKCRHTPIGTELLKGISGGEKKRLSFASEIVNDPSLLFVDEPTSGLDSFMAESVVKTLRAMTAAGKTVVATIHQPSSEVYQLFDKVLFLAEGRVAYFGDRDSALPYFAMHGFPCPEYTNPADFFIHTLSVLPNKEEASRRRLNRISDAYEASENAAFQRRASALPRKEGTAFEPRRAAEELGAEEKQIAARLWEQWRESAGEDGHQLGKLRAEGAAEEGDAADAADAADGKPDGEQGAAAGDKASAMAAASTPLPDGEEEGDLGPNTSFCTQLALLTHRAFLAIMRDPTLTKARLGQSIVLSIIAGLIYADTELNQQGIQNLSGAMFFILINQSFSGVFGVLQTFPLELPVFHREHKAGLYRTDAYYLAKTIADLPFQVVFTVLFCSIAYFLVGFSATFSQFLIFTGTIVLCSNTAFSLGYLISCASSSVGVALAIGPVVLLPFLLFGGFFVNQDSIPVYFKWIEKLSFFNYGFEILMVNEFDGVTNIECNFQGSAADSCATTGDQVLTRFGARKDEVGLDFGILFVLLVGFRLLAFLALLRQSYKRASA